MTAMPRVPGEVRAHPGREPETQRGDLRANHPPSRPKKGPGRVERPRERRTGTLPGRDQRGVAEFGRHVAQGGRSGTGAQRCSSRKARCGACRRSPMRRTKASTPEAPGRSGGLGHGPLSNPGTATGRRLQGAGPRVVLSAPSTPRPCQKVPLPESKLSHSHAHASRYHSANQEVPASLLI